MMQRQIGVVGSWEDDLAPEIYRIAESVGRLVAERGDIVFTGAGTGVMTAAMRGAKKAGGLTVGLVPAENPADYADMGDHMDVRIMTGQGELGKMAPLIHSVDGVIAVAGGAGTLVELAMAYISAKPVVLIPVAGHTTAAIEPMLAAGYLDCRQITAFQFADDAEQAVTRLYSRLSHRNID